MHIEKLYFATTNEEKFKEAVGILAMPLQRMDINIMEIQSLNVEEIAHYKVARAYELIKKPIIVYDVGLYLAAWNGFPGPFIKYLRETMGKGSLLKLMGGESNRTVILKAAIGFHDGEHVHVFVGEVEGELVREPRGVNGWGFDPLIIPKGSDKTLAEVSPQKKFAISHRGRALAKLKAFLIDHYPKN